MRREVDVRVKRSGIIVGAVSSLFFDDLMVNPYSRLAFEKNQIRDASGMNRTARPALLRCGRPWAVAIMRLPLPL